MSLVVFSKKKNEANQAREYMPQVTGRLHKLVMLQCFIGNFDYTTSFSIELRNAKHWLVTCWEIISRGGLDELRRDTLQVVFWLQWACMCVCVFAIGSSITVFNWQNYFKYVVMHRWYWFESVGVGLCLANQMNPTKPNQPTSQPGSQHGTVFGVGVYYYAIWQQWQS